MSAIKIHLFKPDPVNQFGIWFEEVLNNKKPNSNAVALSTSSAGGRISSRMVLLKAYDRSGFVFFSNYESRKGEQMRTNPVASLLFYWPEMGRQVRVEGKIKKTSARESDEYFESRTPGHQLNAIISRQSKEIPDLESLVLASEKIRIKQQKIIRPKHWGGYRLVPDLFEFWQEGEDRFHDRIEYRLSGSKWIMRRLAP